MEILFEILFQIFFEFILEIIAEVLIELGLHSIGQVFHNRRARNPVFAFIGYAILGVIIGALSLLIFPHPLMPSASIRGINLHGIGLLISPVLAGLVMSAIGSLRRKRGMSVIRLDSFGYGFIFAFGMALIRFLFTN
ncbi:MAG: hypothetical protein WBV94_30235 [Blastocatellia bacterium]